MPTEYKLMKKKSTLNEKNKNRIEETESQEEEKQTSKAWKPRKDPNKSKKTEQKVGRNSSSNILRMFFRQLNYKLQHNPNIII